MHRKTLVTGVLLLLAAALLTPVAAQGAQALGDLPQPFVEDDGDIAAAVVVGTDAQSIDFEAASSIVTALSDAANTPPSSWPTTPSVLDSEPNVSQIQEQQHLILIGGPAVNDLTDQLHDADRLQLNVSAPGGAVIEYVPNAFTDDRDTLVIAGYTGNDTRAAANQVADWTENGNQLQGRERILLTDLE